MEQMIILPELRLDAVLAASIAALQHYAPVDGSPYWGAFSGGKDSVVMRAVADLAGVNVEWVYNNTTVDPPELVRFIREHHSDVKWHQPRRGMFKAIREKASIPTRTARWCCQELKEGSTPADRRLMIGVRAAESRARALRWSTATKRRRTGQLVIAPILHWTGAHVWEFIRSRGVKYCSLYDDGFDRLGCIGCPMASAQKRAREFARWPKHERAMRAAAQHYWNKRAGTKQRDGREWFGSARFSSVDELWRWWLNDEPFPGEPDECQGVLDLWT